MSDKILRSKLIRLAHTNPDLREVLLPLLKTAAFDPELAEDLRQLFILIARNAKTALRALLSDNTDVEYRDLFRKILAKPMNDAHRIILDIDNKESWRTAAQERYRVLVYDSLETSFEPLEPDIVDTKNNAIRKAVALAKKMGEPAQIVYEDYEKNIDNSKKLYILPDGRMGGRTLLKQFYQENELRYQEEQDAFIARSRIDRDLMVKLLRKLETEANYLAKLVYSVSRNGGVKYNGDLLLRKTHDFRDVMQRIQRAMFVEP